MPNFDLKWTSVEISAQEGHSDQGFIPFKDEGWVTPPGKPLRPAEVIAEDKEDLKWIEEEGDNEYQL